tara:strand:- start:576 stop:728 length:153 start_codon:yes stop_codon:yes gene_type:complete
MKRVSEKDEPLVNVNKIAKIQQLKKHCESLSDQNIDALIDLAKSWKQYQQ